MAAGNIPLECGRLMNAVGRSSLTMAVYMVVPLLVDGDTCTHYG